MFEPSIDRLVSKAGNRYKLCIVVSKRARDLVNYECAKDTENETFRFKKPLTIAIEELLDGVVTINE